MAIEMRQKLRGFTKEQAATIAPSLAQPPGAGFRVAYVKDPDGNWIELYQHFKPLGPSIPEGY